MSGVRRPKHASEDGSFGRSAGMAAGRGALLLAVAVVLGIVLLNAADDPPPDRLVTGGGRSDDTVVTTTTTLPATTAPTVPLRAPKDVKVISANGTALKGVARKVTDQLKAAGYNVLAPTDAKRADASAVYFTPGFEREAQALAATLGLAPADVKALPTPAPVPDARGANIVVVVGPELAERLSGASTSAPATGAPTTTTTAAGRTSTRP